MSGCLRERALIKLHLGDASGRDRAHLGGCAECQARYQRLLADLQAIHQVLKAPPPRLVEARAWSHPWRALVPASVMATAVLAVIVGVLGLRQLRGPEAAGPNGTVSSLAADVSAAVFNEAGSDDAVELAFEAPYLHNALGSGWPCTGDAFLNGECNDQLSALFDDTDFGG